MTGHDPQQVEDPGEFNQRLRLREIAEARLQAREALSSPDPRLSDAEQRLEAFRKVQALADELEWIIRNQGAGDYFEQSLGTITISPPSSGDFADEAGTPIKRFIGSDVSPAVYEIKGLYSTESSGPGYVDFPGSVAHTWTRHADVRHRGPTNISVTREVAFPMTVSKKANRLCRKFINEAGLDARIEKQIDRDPNPV